MSEGTAKEREREHKDIIEERCSIRDQLSAGWLFRGKLEYT